MSDEKRPSDGPPKSLAEAYKRIDGAAANINKILDEAKSEWQPPFCARDTDLKCPRCHNEGGGSVYVRDVATVYDGDTLEGYCSDCHAGLEIGASVEITYTDVSEAV